MSPLEKVGCDVPLTNHFLKCAQLTKKSMIFCETKFF